MTFIELKKFVEFKEFIELKESENKIENITVYNCILMLQSILSICFCKFLKIVSSVDVTWDMCIFKIHDFHYSSRNVFYSRIQRIL